MFEYNDRTSIEWNQNDKRPIVQKVGIQNKVPRLYKNRWL